MNAQRIAARERCSAPFRSEVDEELAMCGIEDHDVAAA
jgi:hypothetical protein